MIIQQQNFNENFNAAVKYEDISLLFTIFSGELADLFMQREQDIFELFSQCGIKYNQVSVYEVYVNKILKEIKEGNEELITGLSFLMCDNNNEIDSDWEANLETINLGIITIGEYLNDNNCNYLKKQILNSIAVRIKPDNKRNLEFKDSTTFTFIYVIGLAYLVYLAFKKKPIIVQPQPKQVAPEISNPAFNVSPDVLIPESQMPKPEVKVETPIQETPKVETPKPEPPTSPIKEVPTPANIETPKP